MLYSEAEHNKRLKAGCGLYCFYAGEEALALAPAQKTLRALEPDAPEMTTLPGPAPTLEEVELAAGTVSFFGGRRVVYLPLLRPAAYGEKDLASLCDTLTGSDGTVFVITCLVEEKYGKLRPGKREQAFFAACEKAGYCAQAGRPTRQALAALLGQWAGECGARFAPGADTALLDRCGEDQFLLRGEVEKLAALAGYGTITREMVAAVCAVTLDADTFDMVRLVSAGQTQAALQKLGVLLAMQNEPLAIAGALAGNYLDIYRAFLARGSRRTLAQLAKDFGYTGRWNYRLENAARTAARCTRAQLEQCLAILARLDLDLKRSRLDKGLLLQKAVCELALAGQRQ